MSGITPILDTLLHQVLGKRVDVPVAKDQPAPVSSTVSSDAVQSGQSDSRLHQQSHNRLSDVVPTRNDSHATGTMTARADQSPASTQTHLSRAAVDIATLLAKFPTSTGAMPAARTALLNEVPNQGATLANALKDGIASSGAFYESHLLRWSQGRFPVQRLWREPQAWLALTFRPVPEPPAPLASGPNAWLQTGRAARADNQASGQASAMPSGGRGALLDGPLRPVVSRSQGRVAAPFQSSVGGPPQEGTNPLAPALERLSAIHAHQLNAPTTPEALQSLVRHQLELLVSPQVQWSGELWPGMPVTIELIPIVESEGEEGRRSEPEQASDERWRARVRLTLDRLGDVTLVLENSGRDWQIEILPDVTESLPPLQRHVADLEARLQLAAITADIRLKPSGVGDE
ncbi:hypothetical protein [Salinicola halophilus]|uniref:hypothetical protein n=1 Tax=Salinicola halophilus TaxID=184065 RepID=UPI000DA24E50|nr:hypothetical protein [Salinicola halophilus]